MKKKGKFVVKKVETNELLMESMRADTSITATPIVAAASRATEAQSTGVANTNSDASIAQQAAANAQNANETGKIPPSVSSSTSTTSTIPPQASASQQSLDVSQKFDQKSNFFFYLFEC